MHKIMGTDDSINSCDCCGKSGLKFTFTVEVGGEILHYGSTCVTKHTGKTAAKANQEIAERDAADKAAKEAIFRRTPEAIAYSEKWEEANRAGLIGRAFKDFCAVEQLAADAKRAEIFGVINA